MVEFIGRVNVDSKHSEQISCVWGCFSAFRQQSEGAMGSEWEGEKAGVVVGKNDTRPDVHLILTGTGAHWAGC